MPVVGDPPAELGAPRDEARPEDGYIGSFSSDEAAPVGGGPVEREGAGERRQPATPAFIAGTSSEYLGRKPLPRAVQDRPIIFIMGPPGVGKSEVARRLLGPDACYLSDLQLLDVVSRRVRARAWDARLLGNAGMILDGPAFSRQRPGFVRWVRELLRLRAEAGGRTIVTEAADGSPLTFLMDVVAPEDRATILLRFPVGRGRRRYAARVCEEMGVDTRHARRLVDLQPWTYERVRAVLGHLRDEDDDSIL